MDEFEIKRKEKRERQWGFVLHNYLLGRAEFIGVRRRLQLAPIHSSFFPFSCSSGFIVEESTFHASKPIRPVKEPKLKLPKL